MSSSDLLTIRGYVQALPYLPGKEETAKVALLTDEGAEYHILHKGAGIGLVSNINANVEVTGSLSPLPYPQDADVAEPGYLLAVKSYRLTDGFDDPWYDDTVG